MRNRTRQLESCIPLFLCVMLVGATDVAFASSCASCEADPVGRTTIVARPPPLAVCERSLPGEALANESSPHTPDGSPFAPSAPPPSPGTCTPDDHPNTPVSRPASLGLRRPVPSSHPNTPVSGGAPFGSQEPGVPPGRPVSPAWASPPAPPFFQPNTLASPAPRIQAWPPRPRAPVAYSQPLGPVPPNLNRLREAFVVERAVGHTVSIDDQKLEEHLKSVDACVGGVNRGTEQAIDLASCRTLGASLNDLLAHATQHSPEYTLLYIAIARLKLVGLISEDDVPMRALFDKRGLAHPSTVLHRTLQRAYCEVVGRLSLALDGQALS